MCTDSCWNDPSKSFRHLGDLRRLDNGYELTRLDRPACTAVQWDEPTKKCTVWFGPGHFEGLTDGSAKSIVAVRNKACGQSDWVKGEYLRGICEGDLY
jgi:hypothetical protein